MKQFLAILGGISIAIIAATIAHAQSAVPPSIPDTISASLLSTQQVYVSWDPSNSTSSIVDGYYLYRNGAFIASIPGYTYYTDTPGGGAFEYTVSAYDVNGNTSGQSNPTAAVTVVGDTVPPTAPTGVTATESSSSITLSWGASTDNIGVIGYYVSRNGVRIQTTDPITGTSYTDTGLNPGATYTYSVAAYDASRNLSPATAFQATTIYDITPPSVPTKIVATVISPTEIDLTWQSSTDNMQVNGYNIYHNGVPIGTSLTNSYADTGLLAQTNYTYNVSAYDEVGNVSQMSSPAISAVTPPLDVISPTTPTNLTATAIDPTDVVLSWRPSTDNIAVAGYTIYRGGNQIATVTATTTYEDSGLATSTYYIYDVIAYDTSNNYSGPVYQTVTTPATMPSSPVVLPPAQTTTPPTTPVTPTSPTQPTAPTTPLSSPMLTVNLSYGARNANVVTLQTFLISQNDLGSSYATGFYGSLTQAAVRQFQCTQNIVCSGSPATTGWGSVGPRTRAAINSL